VKGAGKGRLGGIGRATAIRPDRVGSGIRPCRMSGGQPVAGVSDPGTESAYQQGNFRRSFGRSGRLIDAPCPRNSFSGREFLGILGVDRPADITAGCHTNKDCSAEN
jgi:hypothetical protein